jgi:hypothetical protein
LTATLLPGDTPALAQQPAAEELPAGLKFVPPDAALFLYADADKVWNSTILKDIRKSDAKTFDFLLATGKKELGIAPADVKSVVAFVPVLKGPQDTERFAVVLTFHKAFDSSKLQAGVEKFLPRNANPKVLTPDARTALVLVNLKEEDIKPQGNWKEGPLAQALKDAASGKFAAVAGSTLASLPDEIRGDNVPGPFRPFQPLFKALSITATLDLEKDPTLDVRVRTATAGQAIDCEKSLGVLLALIQEELEKGVKEFDTPKEPGLKDLVALMKAAGMAAKGAKFSTLGNEARLTVSMKADLPYAAAYMAARKKIDEAMARQVSANNMKQLGLALHNYHDTHGNFPPAAVCDKNGKPMLSWRVLILPYIEQDNLYKQFKLDEPWDSEHNKKLIEKMPKVYAIPGRVTPGEYTTHYRVFVGNGAGFDWIMGGKLLNITDGTSNTFMCVTAAEAVPWTKPDELEFNPEKDMTKLLGEVVNGRCQVGMFDGSVRTLSKIPPKATLNALITRGGGEVIDFDF